MKLLAKSSLMDNSWNCQLKVMNSLKKIIDKQLQNVPKSNEQTIEIMG